MGDKLSQKVLIQDKIVLNMKICEWNFFLIQGVLSVHTYIYIYYICSTIKYIIFCRCYFLFSLNIFQTLHFGM